MEDFHSLVSDQKHLLIGGAVLGATCLLGYVCYKRRNLISFTMKGRVDISTFTKRDCVYIIVPPRIGTVTNLSPFCVKLETWLRMAEIPHQVVETLFPSPSKKTFPYIYLNGEEMADSKFIIDKLSGYFGKNLNQHLTEMEKALFVAYTRLLEDHMVIAYALHRYTIGADQFWANFNDEERLGSLGAVLLSAKGMMKKVMTDKAMTNGIGRHSPDEIYQLAEENLKSLSVYLGDRDYFFGTRPSVIDCTLFAHLTQMVFIKTDYPPGKKIFSEYINLLHFVERMKARFYPDWDKLC